jgi:hypothetical protein
MEVDVEHSKESTILPGTALHGRLARLAAQCRTSIGEAVRTTCERRCGMVEDDDRLSAVRALAEFRLPVADVATMKRESLSDLGKPLT